MDQFTELLLARKKELEGAIRQALEVLESSPPGFLKISSSGQSVQFYLVDESGNTTYLSKKANSKLISELAQKSHAQHFLPIARKELTSIDRLLKKRQYRSTDQLFAGLSEERKALVQPFLWDDDYFAYQWENQPFTPNPFHPEDKLYSTNHGETVRSKSELVFANMFFELGIPFKYECPLLLSNGKVSYPDFTLLKKSTRQVYYHEHFGLFDDIEYRNNALRKMDAYRRNGIFVGKNLIITYETSDCPLDIPALKKSFAEIFLDSSR